MLDVSGQVTTIYSFTGGADGLTPLSRLTFDQSGNIYGSAQSGGKYSGGVIYEIIGGAVK